MKLDNESEDALSRVTVGGAIAVAVLACLSAFVQLVLA